MISLLAFALSNPAQAIDYKWWGAGPTIQTMLIPSQYPSRFPDDARGDSSVDDQESDEAQDEFGKVKGDVALGARVTMYPGSSGRIGARSTIGFASGYSQFEFLLEYEALLKKDGAFQVLGGGALGAGRESFRDVEAGGTADFYGDNAGDKLTVGYFPVRAELSALLRDKTRAYELGAWVTWHIAGSQTYGSYNAQDVYKEESAVDEDQGLFDIAGSFYGGIGINATVWFGDFKSDKKKSNNSSKKKKK